MPKFSSVLDNERAALSSAANALTDAFPNLIIAAVPSAMPKVFARLLTVF